MCSMNDLLILILLMSAGHSPNVTCQNIIFFWCYINVVRQQTYRKSASFGSRGLRSSLQSSLTKKIKMRLFVSLAFICLLFPAGKNTNIKAEMSWVFSGLCGYLTLFFVCSVWIKMLHLQGCKSWYMWYDMDLSCSLRPLFFHLR